jgi:hypothetical protein
MSASGSSNYSNPPTYRNSERTYLPPDASYESDTSRLTTQTDRASIMAPRMTVPTERGSVMVPRSTEMKLTAMEPEDGAPPERKKDYKGRITVSKKFFFLFFYYDLITYSFLRHGLVFFYLS